MSKAVKSFSGFSMDYTSQIQWGQAADGRIFRRSQFRDPRYGYKWSAWRPASQSEIEGKYDNGPKNWRLPN